MKAKHEAKKEKYKNRVIDNRARHKTFMQKIRQRNEKRNEEGNNDEEQGRVLKVNKPISKDYGFTRTTDRLMPKLAEVTCCEENTPASFKFEKRTGGGEFDNEINAIMS